MDPAHRILCCGYNRHVLTDYLVLWRKRDSKSTLSRGEHPHSCLDKLLLLFWAHYIEDGPYLLCRVHFRWLPFTENEGEDVANYIRKEAAKDVANYIRNINNYILIFTNVKGRKVVELVTLLLGRFSIDFRKLL